jgi:hypothetical protein
MSKMLKKILGIIMLGLIPFSVMAGNWWDRDFQKENVHLGSADGSGTWGSFIVHGCNPHNPWHLGVGGGVVRAGAQSFRFENRPGQMRGDCNYHLAEFGERTELVSVAPDRPGNDVWYAWSVYHKDFKFISNGAPTQGQFKTEGAGHQYLMFRMDESRGMVADFNAFEGWAGSDKVVIPKSQVSNKWNDIRVHAKWSTGTDGLIQIWVNGVLKVTRRGRNAIDNDAILFRFGIYKSDTNRIPNNVAQVVYYDEVMRGGSCESVSQFMTCPGGTTNTGGTTSSGGSPAGIFEAYVNRYRDLNAAYNRGNGTTKAEFGKWHYCNHGAGEGRTVAGISLALCGASLNTATPDINTTVDEVDDGTRGGRFTDEITSGVRRFSRVAIFNGSIFSFKDYHTFKAYEVNDKQGLMLGFSKQQNTDGTIDDPIGIGWLFDNVALMVAQDNSMLGYKANGIFDFKDPSTTYVDIGHRKKFADNITLFTDLIYAYGRSSDGELVQLSNIHALGFESKLEYAANDANTFVFRFDLPLHIENGSSRFIVSQFGQPVPLNIDLVPDGREMQLNFMHSYRVTKTSNITTELTYINDVDHRKGANDYSAMIKYNIHF